MFPLTCPRCGGPMDVYEVYCCGIRSTNLQCASLKCVTDSLIEIGVLAEPPTLSYHHVRPTSVPGLEG